jgi:hypothetical protein
MFSLQPPRHIPTLPLAERFAPSKSRPQLCCRSRQAPALTLSVNNGHSAARLLDLGPIDGRATFT